MKAILPVGRDSVEPSKRISGQFVPGIAFNPSPISPKIGALKASCKNTGLVLGLISLLLLGFEALIFFEFIRLFHDNNIDQPLGLWGAGLGASLSLFALLRRQGAILLNVIALVLNVAALSAVGLIAWSLSHMKLM